MSSKLQPEQPTAPAENKAPRNQIIELSRRADGAVETVLVTALRAAIWKTGEEGGPVAAGETEKLTVGTAIEVERRLRVYNTPADIQIYSGTVKPVEGLESELEETPLVQAGEAEPPSWATTETPHSWLEVDPVGAEESFLLDPAAPPQITARPTSRPQIYEIEKRGCRPEQYVPSKESPTRLSDSSDTIQGPPWSARIHAWPFGTPEHISAVPADGGVGISVDANTVVEIDARDGLNHLPTDSIDCIITSPPYRLQREYPNAEAVWDAAPDCDHNWEETLLNTETPIRENGGAGLNSEGTAEELQNERNRISRTCTKCGGWKGQLGHEPELSQFISHLVSIFRECRRVLKPDGNLFVNVSDSYDSKQTIVHDDKQNEGLRDAPDKSLIGFPARLMVAMIEDGWSAREHYIWHKENHAPDPAPDRAGKAYEDVFRFVQKPDYNDTGDGPQSNVLSLGTASGTPGPVAPMPKKLPEQLLESAVAPEESAVVLDPFAGSGTVLEAAAERGYDYIGFEISPETANIARDRLSKYNRPQRSLTGQAALGSFA
jgi:DNA modification methylase